MHALRRRRHLITASCTAVLALAAAGAPAAAAKPLWATVNICDTPAHEDTVGIRAAMPGTGDRGVEMFMRFRLQFFRVNDTSWHPTGPKGDSGWVDAGSAARARQSGRDFLLAPPRKASEIVRGIVFFEWRRDGVAIRSARRITQAGHPNTVGADPADFSAASCEIR
jgi:hypothetical protein